MPAAAGLSPVVFPRRGCSAHRRVQVHGHRLQAVRLVTLSYSKPCRHGPACSSSAVRSCSTGVILPCSNLAHCLVLEHRSTGMLICRHRTEHNNRVFNVTGCDPAVHKRCSFLQLTTTYCGMWAGLRSEVRCCRLRGSQPPEELPKASHRMHVMSGPPCTTAKLRSPRCPSIEDSVTSAYWVE